MFKSIRPTWLCASVAGRCMHQQQNLASVPVGHLTLLHRKQSPDVTTIVGGPK